MVSVYAVPVSTNVEVCKLEQNEFYLSLFSGTAGKPFSASSGDWKTSNI